MVAIKTKVSKLDSCDLEADKVKGEVTNVNLSKCEQQLVILVYFCYLQMAPYLLIFKYLNGLEPLLKENI